jgi:alpha-tubulin suppressor-like RCC1 family protein
MFKEISVGSEHVVAITEAGKLFAWGSNCEGQLGIPNLSS